MQELSNLKNVIDHFSPIPGGDWDLLMPHITHKHIKKHGLFSTAGKQANEVGFILSGIFRQYYDVGEDEKTTWFFFKDDLLCSYISCICGQPSLVSIEALSDEEYLSFRYSIMNQLYAQSAAWLNFGRKVAEYIATGLEARMVSLLTQKPEERYRQLLADKEQKIIAQIPQQYIANFLGITPVSLSRIRGRRS